MKRIAINIQNQSIFSRATKQLFDSAEVVSKCSGNKDNFMGQLTKASQRTDEPIFFQTVWRAATRFSASKKDWMLAIKDFISYDIHKVGVEDLMQKTDVRFLAEARVAIKLSTMSGLITSVTLAYEDPAKKTFDLMVTLQNRNIRIQIPRDVKSGNNLYDVRGNKVGEIPVLKNSKESYIIINKGYTINQINADRFTMISQSSALKPTETYYGNYLELKYSVERILNNQALDDVSKHYHIQDCILNYIITTKDSTSLKFSLFTLHIVDESNDQINKSFSETIEEVIKADSLESTDNAKQLFGSTLAAYSNNVQNLADTLSANKTFWNSIGMGDIIKYVIQ